MGLIKKYGKTPFIVLTAALILFSCDDGIGLLTMDERQSLYRAEAGSRGMPIPASSDVQGVILDPLEGITIVFETLRGSEEPVELHAVLKDSSGFHAKSFRYHTSEAPARSSDSSSDKMVSSLVNLSQTFQVPSEFPDGYYELTLEARSARAEVLSRTILTLFLVRGSVPQPAILVYPPNPSPGSRVLLLADLDECPGDPFLRWTVDGIVRSEGTVSEGKDKLLWQAPLAGQAAPVALALYPAAPPAGTAFSFPAPRAASTNLLVSPGASVPPDEFSDSRRFLALFHMEDTPDYEGTAPGAGAFLGSPRLDVHAGGFGLALGGDSTAGIRADNLLLPVRGTRLEPFSLLARLAPKAPAQGVILTAVAGTSLEFTLTEGRPGVVLASQEKTAELKADAFLTPGRSAFLAVSVLPEGPALRVLFFVDGKPAGGGILPFGAEGWSESGVTTVAGPGGCPGLYDEIGVWAFDERGEAAVYPAFFFASLREQGADLRFAEGFEGTAGPGLLLSGSASVSAAEGLLLPPGARAVFDVPLEAPFRVEAALAFGAGARLYVKGSAGEASVPLGSPPVGTDRFFGLPLASARAEPEGSGGGLVVTTPGGSIRIPGPGPWRVGVQGPDEGSAAIRSFRVLRARGIPAD